MVPCAALNRVGADRHLLPVRAIRNREARHAARSASGQMNDPARELRSRPARRNRRRHVREARHLNLFAAPNLFKTSRNVFAHIVRV